MEDGLGHRRVLKVAIPIMLSNATVPILGAVDTGVVGQLGEAAPIGAVGIGAIILTGIYWIFGFLRMGTVGLTSQAYGAGRRGEVAVMLSRSLLIGFAAGFGIIALQLPLFAGAFMVSPASAQVEHLARDYMQIRIYSAPAAIALYGITGWLIAQERTGAVFWVQLWMNGLNIVLDLVFVLGLGWGVEGVALATFLAEWSGLGLGLWLCRDAFRHAAWKDPLRVFDPPQLKRMGLVNLDILIRSLLLQLAFISFLFFGADLGDVTLAANQILLQFLSISAFALDGFAFAAETLVGQAVGARDRLRLRHSAVLTGIWGVVISLLIALIYVVFGAALIDVMTTSPDVQAEARLYLGYVFIAPMAGIAAFMLDGVFIGATRTKDMRNMMVVSFIAYAALLAVLLPVWGNDGLWVSLLLFLAIRGITLGWKYPSLERAV